MVGSSQFKSISNVKTNKSKTYLAYTVSKADEEKNHYTYELFIHSDEDYRCPIEQALQFYTVIKENGVDTRFAWFKGENHDLSRSGRPQSRVRRLEEITKLVPKIQ